MELGVREVWSGPQAEPIPARVDENPDAAQALRELERPLTAQRQEAARALERDRAVARELLVQVERVERGRQQSHLVLANLAQELRRKPLGLEETEDARGPVVAGGIVGGSGPA